MRNPLGRLLSTFRSDRHYGCPGWTPEETYCGSGPVAALHRARLRRILRAVDALPLPERGEAADFGCANGHILASLRAGRLPAGRWLLTGLDNDREQLGYALEKGIPDASFHFIDLNVPNPQWSGRFDFVMSFETLEHAGDYRAGFRTLVDACRPGGFLLVAVPNETGLPGLAKFYGRKIFHSNSYFDVLRGKRERDYVCALLRGTDLEVFRDPPRTGWGDHLGFDVRSFERFVDEEFLRTARLRRRARITGLFDFGRLYAFDKPATSAEPSGAAAAGSR